MKKRKVYKGGYLNGVMEKQPPLEEMRRKKMPTKKKYNVSLTIDRVESVKDYLKKSKNDKVSFSELMDYLLKQFYNQFKNQIEKKEAGKKAK